MKLKKYKTLALILVLTVTGCKKKDTTPDAPQPEPYIVTANVYVAGQFYRNSVGQPGYWKNGVVTILSNNPAGGGVNGITVQGNDVYAAGYLSTTGGGSIAAYWKNGVAINLGAGLDSGCGPLVVQGNDVYISGYSGSSPVYWKNGVSIGLPISTSSYGSTSGIAVQGNDVYVSGWRSTNSGPWAVYWKNGTRVDLSNSFAPAYGGQMAVQGNDVYVAASYVAADADKTIASYWKNSAPVNIASGGLAINPIAIAVNGSNVYVAGQASYKTFGGVKVAAYWKNGEINYLMGDIGNESYASGIALQGNDVYVGGYGTYQHQTLGMFWKNGTSVVVNDPGSSTSPRIFAIAAAPL